MASRPTVSVVSPGPRALHATPISALVESPVQREIEAIWLQVQSKVVELAGGDTTKLQMQLGIDEVLQFVEDAQDASAKKSDKYKKFRYALNRTLRCIQTVGGIIVNGVSKVYPPTQLCYNALVFVIQAWNGYEGIFSNLAELLDKCVEFLERLDYYRERMDVRLARLACQNLQLFVNICEATIRLRKKHTRFLAFTKQLFLNDSGIQGLLGKMERLNGKESLLVNAQTYSIVATTFESQAEAKRAIEDRERRQIIIKALGIPPSVLGVDNEPVPIWQRNYEIRRHSLVEGMGDWIFSNKAFQHWSTAAHTHRPIMILEGKNGSGKTSLLTNILQKMRRESREANSDASRLVLAYFFPDPRSSRRADADKKHQCTFVENVTSAILWQVAASSDSMTMSTAQIAVARNLEFEGVKDLWTQIFFNNAERLASKNKFIIFIDGHESDVALLAPIVQLFAESVKSHHKDKTCAWSPRLIFTSRPQATEEILSSLPDSALKNTIERLAISEQNSCDTERYIVNQMDKMPILQDPSRPGILEWRKTILETLNRTSGGDFIKLNAALDALAKVDLVEDVRRVLAESGKTRADQIDGQLRRLRHTRSDKEVEEINEIILWLDAARISRVDADLLEAVLAIKHRTCGPGLGSSVSGVTLSAPPHLTKTYPLTKRDRSRPRLSGERNESISPVDISQGHKSLSLPVSRQPSPVLPQEQQARNSPGLVSLLPFQQKIAEKYPIFTVLEPIPGSGSVGIVAWQSPEFHDRVPDKDTFLGSRPGTPLLPQSVVSPLVQKSEVAIVRHFLHSVCPPELYRRFDFDGFLDSKLGYSVGSVNRGSLRAGRQDGAAICRDPTNADARIALACLSMLSGEEGEIVGAGGSRRGGRLLRRYALRFLLSHLQDVELGGCDRALRKSILDFLRDTLFKSGHAIESLFWPFESTSSFRSWSAATVGENSCLREARGAWLYSDDGALEMEYWARSSTDMKRPGQTTKLSAEMGGDDSDSDTNSADEGVAGLGITLTNSNNDYNARVHEAMLTPSATHMARKLFCGSACVELTRKQTLAGGRFLRAFIKRFDVNLPGVSSELDGDVPSKISMHESSKDVESMTDEDDRNLLFKEFEAEHFTIAEVERIEAYASPVLSSSEACAQSVWKTRMAMLLVHLCTRTSNGAVVSRKALALVQEALALDSSNPAANYFVASHPTTGNTEAVDSLLRARIALEAETKQEYAPLLAKVVLELGTRLWLLGANDREAASLHRDSISIDSSTDVVGLWARVMSLYQARKAWGEVIDFLSAVTAAVAACSLDRLVYDFFMPDGGPPKTPDAAHEFLLSDVVQMCTVIALAADSTGRWDMVADFFERAIETAKTESGTVTNGNNILFALRSLYARTLDCSALDDEGDNDDALWLASQARQAKTVEIREAALLHARAVAAQLHGEDDDSGVIVSKHFVGDQTVALARGYLALSIMQTSSRSPRTSRNPTIRVGGSFDVRLDMMRRETSSGLSQRSDDWLSDAKEREDYGAKLAGLLHDTEEWTSTFRQLEAANCLVRYQARLERLQQLPPPSPTLAPPNAVAAAAREWRARLVCISMEMFGRAEAIEKRTRVESQTRQADLEANNAGVVMSLPKEKESDSFNETARFYDAAYWTLLRVLAAAGDAENLRAVCQLRNALTKEWHGRWNAWNKEQSLGSEKMREDGNSTGHLTVSSVSVTKSIVTDVTTHSGSGSTTISTSMTTTAEVKVTEAEVLGLGNEDETAREALGQQDEEVDVLDLELHTGHASPNIPESAYPDKPTSTAHPPHATIAASQPPAPTPPPKPLSYTYFCDGCMVRWTVTTQPFYMCADCAGATLYCVPCRRRMVSQSTGRLVAGSIDSVIGGDGGGGAFHPRPGLGCRRDHEMILVPGWDADAMGKDSRSPGRWVPVLEEAKAGAGAEDKQSWGRGVDEVGVAWRCREWIQLDEWRGKLKKAYLGDG